MTRRSSDNLSARVEQAAAACLERNGCVGPLELLQQMRLLQPVHVEAWQKGDPYYTPLEPHIQCGTDKLQKTYRYFEEWVRQRGLVPVEASYIRSSPRGAESLHITADAEPERERFFRTRYAPADL